MHGLSLAVLVLAASGCDRLLPFQASRPDQARADTPRGRDVAAEPVPGPDRSGWSVDRSADSRAGDKGKPDTRPPDKSTPNTDLSFVGCEITDPGIAMKAGDDTMCSPGTLPVFDVGLGVSPVLRGQNTIVFDCTACPGEEWAILTRMGPTAWDLTTFDTFTVWMYTQTVHPLPFWKASSCNPTPTLVLEDDAGARRTIQRTGATPNPDGSLNTWQPFTGPLKSSDASWTGSGTIDWAAVRVVELHIGPSNYLDFYVHFDGLTFTGGSAPFSQCP